MVALLLAGAFSALVVAADQMVTSWVDGQMVLAWIGLWAMLFAALVLFAEASRGWAASIVRMVESWSEGHARQLEEKRTWRFAQSDARFMSDLQVARCRAEQQALDAGEPPPAWPVGPMSTRASSRGLMG
jgi:hypothetical protein